MNKVLYKKNKYNAIKTKIDEISFDSKAEANRYIELKLLQRTNKIKWFIRQPKFDLPGSTSYRADFLIVWDNDKITIEDVKGVRTPSFIRAKKQVEALYPIKIEIVK